MRLSVHITPASFLLTLAIASFPFYVFPSGGVQPSHLLFLAVSLAGFSRLRLPNQTWLILLAVLSAYVLVVELVAAIAAGETKYLIFPAYFLFNFILMAGVYPLVLRQGAGVLRAGLIAATVIAVAVTIMSGVNLQEFGPGGRPTGTFNNPNQLGYFSVCIMSLAYLCYIEEEVSFPVMLALVGASVFLAIASLSKAAMIASFGVLALALRPKGGRAAMISWLLVALVGLAGVIYLLNAGYFERYIFYNRIINMPHESDSSLDSRGYFAFQQGSLLQNIFGMGSPDVHEVVGHEVHSTFASVWNTYGVVGIALFAPIFITWITTLTRAYGLIAMTVITVPSLLYGITHNGTRFSIFWLLVAASMAAAHRRSQHAARARADRRQLLDHAHGGAVS